MALAASGRLNDLGGAVTVGLTVIAGAGSWLAARQAFPRVGPADLASLVVLGVATLAATVASVWLGTALGTALTLHVLPKAAGIVLLAVAADVAGVPLPKLRGLPLPLVVLAASGVLEVALQWTP